MSVKLLWTAVTVYFIGQAFGFPEINVVAAILAIIGIILLWLNK